MTLPLVNVDSLWAAKCNPGLTNDAAAPFQDDPVIGAFDGNSNKFLKVGCVVKEILAR
jgi:hypothetical protein